MRRTQIKLLVQKYYGVQADPKDEHLIKSLFNLLDGNHRTNPHMFRSEWKTIKRAYKGDTCT